MPSSYLVLVCGLEVSSKPAQTREELEAVFQDRFPNARILVFDGLRSGTIHSLQTGHIRRASEDLLQLLADEAGLQERTGGPILFLAQNLGGLIVKQALLEATRDWEYQHFIWRTAGLFFFGTLHRVSNETSLEKQLMRHVLATTQHIPDPLAFIQEFADMVASIAVPFSLLMSTFTIVNFVESPDKRECFGTGLANPVVDESSSIFGIASEKIINASCTHGELWWFAPGDPKTESLWSIVDDKTMDKGSNVEYSVFMQALAGRDPGIHLDAFSDQHPTMQWITTNDTFLNWLVSSENSILHIFGKPGSGSSYVSSFIMQHVTAIPDYRTATFITFSCHKQYIQTTDPANILLSLCRQILNAKPMLFRRTQPLCKSILEQSLFDKAGMWALLQSLLEFHQEDIFGFINGIHNCHDSLLENLQNIASIQRESCGPLKFVLTSCSETEIIFPSKISTLLPLNISKQLEMRTASEEAMRQRVLSNARKSLVWFERDKQVMDSLCEGSPPYLLMMQRLRLLEASIPYSTEAALTTSLGHLPKDLDGLYSHYITNLPSWERQVLGCIGTAVRPLRSAELAICLALALQGSKAQTLRDLRDHTSCDIIKDVSSSKAIAHLIKVRNDRLYPIHETLTDYLHTRHRHVSSHLHLSMLNACIKYISHFHHDRWSVVGVTSTPKPGSQQRTATLSKEAGFLKYSTLCWTDHYNLCQGHSRAHETVSKLLKHGPLRSTWFSLYAHFKSNLDDTLEPLAFPIAAASRLGLTQIVDELIRNIVKGGKDTSVSLPSPLADLRISSKQPWASAIDLRRQLIEECVSFAAADGRDELIVELSSFLSSSILENKGQEGLTPLLRAAQGGHMNVVDALVKYGASSGATGRDGSTILHIAARLGNKSMVEQILQLEEPPDITAINSEGYDAAKIAAESGFHAILSLLLASGVNKEAIVNEPILFNKKTPLFLAAEHGHVKVVQLLLEHGADPTIHDESESSAIYQAAKHGDTEMFALLLAQPVYQKLKISPSPSTATGDGDQNRGIGQDNRHASQKAILDNADGTSISASDDLEACFSVAAEHGQPKILALLLQYDIQVDRPSKGGNTPLHLAARMGFAKVVQNLLNHRCKLDSQNDEKLMPIQLAAEHGHLDVVEIMLKHGRGVESLDQEPLSSTEPFSLIDHAILALEAASRAGHVSVVMYLLDQDVERAPRALEVAAESGQHAVIQALRSSAEKFETVDHQAIYKAAREALQRRHHRALDALLSPEVSWKLLPDESAEELYGLLYAAIQNDDGQAISVLARNGFDMNRQNRESEDPLHIAVAQNKPKVVKPLIEGGADGEALNREEETPLYVVCKEGEEHEMARQLLEAGVDPDARKKSNDTTALHVACEVIGDNSAIISYLLKHGATPNIKDDTGWTPLHYAVGSLANTAALVGSNGERRELVGELNDYRSTALILAAEMGNAEVIEFLLKHGADPTIRNKTGSSAFHRASQNGYLEVVRLLLENEYKTVDPTIFKDSGATALHMAAYNGHFDIVEYLLSKDAVEINAYMDNNHITPLSVAILGERRDITRLLLKRGADPNIRSSGKAAMELAIETADSEMVQIVLGTSRFPLSGLEESLRAAVRKDMLSAMEALIKHDPSLLRNSQIAPGCTLLTYAIMWDSYEVADYLVKNSKENSVCLDQPNDAGDAAIHLAIKNRNMGIVSKLLEHDANPNLCDLAGTTPTMLSARSGQADILHLLLTKDVNIFQKDLHKRDALYWACLSGFGEVIKQVVAKMRGSSEWHVCCSAALHPVLAAENSMELFEALLGDEDEESRSKIVAILEPDRNGWTLAYAMKHGRSQSLSKLPIWFQDAVKRSEEDDALSPQPPTRWDTKERPFPLEVSEDGQTVTVGPGALPNVEQSLIHSDFCIPADQDYYFEITMAAPPERSEPPEGPFEIGVGLCVENMAGHVMLGSETGSIGLLGDDGRTYAQVGWGQPYSDAFGLDDTIGCKVQVKDGERSVSFIKNKRPLGVAFEGDDIPCGQLYPAISIDAKLRGFRISGRFGSSAEGELRFGPQTPDSKNKEFGQVISSSIGVTRRESSGANNEDEDRDDDSDFSW